MKHLLHRGFIALPEGDQSQVLGFTPPLTITKAQLKSALQATRRVFEQLIPKAD